METLELINIICPEHDRTSCSDENISNGFYFEDEFNTTISRSYFPRCSRCALLEIANGTATDDNKILNSFSIHFKN
jgi:hypothetical protein